MLEKLPEKELLALMMFSYMLQLDNPLTLFGAGSDAFNVSDKIKRFFYIENNGNINIDKTDRSIFTFELTLNVIILHASIANILVNEPSATEEDIGIYSLDGFLVQIAPQWWEQSQFFSNQLTKKHKESWLENIHSYSKNCGFSAEVIYEQLFMPLLGLLFKTRQTTH
jgi:hypothetical protein